MVLESCWYVLYYLLSIEIVTSTMLICTTAQNFPKARERLEDLKRNGGKGGMKARERISRSKVGKQQEGECVLM